MLSRAIMFVLQAWKSLIVVSGSPYRIDTSSFADQVRKYNLIAPFNFPDVSFPISHNNAPIEKYMSIYAAHLYDSVILYAKVGSRLALPLGCLMQEIIRSNSDSG